MPTVERFIAQCCGIEIKHKIPQKSRSWRFGRPWLKFTTVGSQNTVVNGSIHTLKSRSRSPELRCVSPIILLRVCATVDLRGFVVFCTNLGCTVTFSLEYGFSPSSNRWRAHLLTYCMVQLDTLHTGGSVRRRFCFCPYSSALYNYSPSTIGSTSFAAQDCHQHSLFVRKCQWWE